MSVIEQSREMTQQDKIDWDYTYTQARGLDKWIPNPLDYMVKKCCDNCESFRNYLTRITFCSSGVANELLINEGIKDSDTFYCSYHKFKV